ncbi:MAG: HD domain-containing protein [Planctomycetes bacterium]|nr:HD domain-containing protein [Planctomycetota bacterium]
MDDHVFVIDLKPGNIFGVYQVAEARALKARNGKPYLALTLKDSSGRIGAKRWDADGDKLNELPPGGFIEVEGNVELYKDQPQIILKAMRPVEAADVNLAHFETPPSFDPVQLRAEVIAILEGLIDPDYLRVAKAYLADEAFMGRFEIGPAARMMHHPYKFGLLEHVHSVVMLGVRLCDHYTWVDRSLVLLGLFLHDSGKVVELVGEDTPGYSVEGELLGHITIGINMLDRKLKELGDIPHHKGILLKHIILSHHENAEYGSPKEPMLAEAQIVHAIEALDAKMNAFLRERELPAERSDLTGEMRYSKLLKRHVYTPPKNAEKSAE